MVNKSYHVENDGAYSKKYFNKDKIEGINFIPTIPFNKDQGEIMESIFPLTESLYVFDDNSGINDIRISTSLSLDKE